MSTRPTVETGRLVLRPFTLDDAPQLHRLAGRREVADALISLPHPYPLALAEKWIEGHEEDFKQGSAVHFAIQKRGDPQLIGAVELRQIDPVHSTAEIIFWIGVPSWGTGYAHESVRATVQHGFERLGLNRIYAICLARSPAPVRVLEKAGFKREGLLRQAVRRWGVFEDVVLLAVVRSDWSPGAE